MSLFSSINSELRYETGYYGGDGPVVNLKITGNHQRRVSSHFERLLSAEFVEALSKTWHAEERDRAAAAQRRRLEERARAEAEEEERAAAAECERVEALAVQLSGTTGSLLEGQDSTGSRRV